MKRNSVHIENVKLICFLRFILWNLESFPLVFYNLYKIRGPDI